jgi:serine/threonine protein kinase/lipoprotein NlpI
MKQTEMCPNADRIAQVLRSLTSEAETQELAEHLDTCTACQNLARALHDQAALEDDLHWAVEARAQAPVQIQAPLHRISEMLPDFEILSELGRGGMGVVYKARQRKLDRLVAVKILPALLGTVRPEARTRFRREAELAAGLDHTNITGVHDFGEVDGTLYYVMQLIEGRSLRDVLNEIADAGTTDFIVGVESDAADSSSRKSSVQTGTSGSTGRGAKHAYFRKVAGWIAEVADALQYAHDRGVVHRDIKPSNLLLADDGRLVISDFGLARMSDGASITQTQALVGTCRYMSPEQIDPSFGPVDRQSDVYSLGATLYELLTLRPLYACTDDRELLRQVVQVDPAPLHRLMPQVPRDLETICLRAIAKERGKRFVTAGEMADDLRRWLLDLPILAKRQSLAERAVRFVRRRKLYSALVAACTMMLAVSVALGLGYRTTRNQAHRARSETTRTRVALALQNATAALDAEQISSALLKIDDGLALDPDDLELNRFKAVALFRKGEAVEAMAVLRGILARDARDWKSHFLAAFALRPCIANDWTCRCIDRSPLLGPNPPDSISVRFEAHRKAVQDWRPGMAEDFCLLAAQEPNPELAIALLDSALDQDPNLAEAVLLRAIRLGMIGKYEAMRRDALEAARLMPGGDAPDGVLATALYSLSRYDEAATAFDSAIKKNPDNVLWWYDRAVVRCYQHRFAEAVADADRAAQINPRYAFAYLARGKAYAGLGDRSAAMRDYDRAEKLDPRIADIYIERCLLNLLDMNYEAALSDADRAVVLQPNSADGYQRRTHAFLKMGRYADAIEQVNICLKLNGDDAVSHLLKGIVLHKAGDYAQALLSLNRAADLDPTDARNYRFRALNLIYLGRYQEALTDLTRLVDQNYEAPITLLRRGMAYEALHETELARADYQRAARFPPPVRDYAELWQWALLRLSDDPKSADELLAQRPSHGAQVDWTGHLFEYLAQRITWDELLASATSDAERSEAHYFGGVVALTEHDTARAVAHFQQSAGLNCDEILEGDFAYVRIRGLGASAGAVVCKPEVVGAPH